MKHIYVAVNHIQLTYSYYKRYSNIFSCKLSIFVINNHFVCDLTKPAWWWCHGITASSFSASTALKSTRAIHCSECQCFSKVKVFKMFNAWWSFNRIILSFTWNLSISFLSIHFFPFEYWMIGDINLYSLE